MSSRDLLVRSRRTQPCSSATTTPEPEPDIEFSFGLQRHDVVEIADVLAVDENLRHLVVAAGALDYFPAGAGLHGHFDLVIGQALVVQKPLGGDAERAPGRGINLDFGHAGLLRGGVGIGSGVI